MSYVVLARRYRPQIFSDLVGQEHVTATLKNAIRQKRTAHAYLFTGPRGVGKTSAARILAKALRCLDLTAEGEPCNKCEACEAVNLGSSLDVLEIDAASNTGVDNIRDLRENVEYMATVGKYRVYIIDEVHMLSTAAFNALLKTLEEPPPHVVFIFATTELHKVLPTIQSRCQRFDFKKIPPLVMTENLKIICAAEGISIDEASLKTLVVESEGCLRDAQSLLDQAITLCGKDIKMSQLESTLGLLDRASFLALIDAIGDHNPGAALKICSQMNSKGIDPKILLNRLVDFFSDLHFRVFTGESRSPDPEIDVLFEKLAQKLSRDEVVRALDLGLRSQSTLGLALNTALSVEAFIVKLCLQRPALGGPVRNADRPSEKAPEFKATSAFKVSQSAAPPRAAESTPSPAAATSGSQRTPFETFIRNQKPAWTPVLQSLLHIESDGTTVTAQVKNDFAGKRLASKDGIEVLKLAYGLSRAVVNVVTETQSPTQESVISPQQKILQKAGMAKDHDAVKSAIKIFDATISETKILDDVNPTKGGPS